jgi:hypothetical protein
MALLALVHPREQAHVSAVTLMTKCALFQNKPALLTAPYRVESPILAEVFRAFVSALEGGAVEITSANWAPLSLLSEEFGFDSLAADLSAFRRRPTVQAMLAVADGDAQSRLASLEARALGRDREIAALQAGLVSSDAKIARLSSAVESLRAALETAEIRTSAKAAELDLGHSRLQSESVRLSCPLKSLRAEVSGQNAPLPPAKIPPAAPQSPSPTAPPPARANPARSCSSRRTNFRRKARAAMDA